MGDFMKREDMTEDRLEGVAVDAASRAVRTVITGVESLWNASFMLRVGPEDRVREWLSDPNFQSLDDTLMLLNNIVDAVKWAKDLERQKKQKKPLNR